MELISADAVVKNSDFAIREDETSTGSTANQTAVYLKCKMEAHHVFLCATHPVCTPCWKRKLLDGNPFENIFLGNTIPRPYQKRTGGEVTTVDMSLSIATRLFEILQG